MNKLNHFQSLRVVKCNSVAIHIAMFKVVCFNCSKSLDNERKKCGKCKAVYFCSRDCQQESWTVHKGHCFEEEQGHYKVIKQDTNEFGPSMVQAKNLYRKWLQQKDHNTLKAVVSMVQYKVEGELLYRVKIYETSKHASFFDNLKSKIGDGRFNMFMSHRNEDVMISHYVTVDGKTGVFAIRLS